MKMSKRDYDFWKYARSFLHEYMPKIRNMSPKSVGTYKQCLTGYIEFLKESRGIERQHVSLSDCGRDNLKLYIQWMRNEKQLSAKTCNLRITAIRSFLKYCSDEDISYVALYLESSGIHGMRCEKKPILYLSRNATKALLAMPKTDTPKERRNRMILILMYDSAARVQELSDLTLKDLHLPDTAPYITLLGKGNKTRNVPIMAKTMKHLMAYLSEFHPQGDTFPCADTPLFFSRRDGRPHSLSTDSISLILKKYADQARRICSEVPENVHCHLIRKTRAMDLYQSGIALPLIMQILGHESTATTSSFYAFATVDMLHEAIKKANPDMGKQVPEWKNDKFRKILFSLD
jgi:site-specific recombinase XerD